MNNNNNIINDEIKIDILTFLNKNNKEELYDEEYYLINLFTIIIDDYQKYPNYNLIETISNIEKFVILKFKDYNKINLQ